MDINPLYVMIIISILAGLLSTMNIWADKIDHIRWHLNDTYMALLMTGWMMIFSHFLLHNHMGSSNTILVISVISVVIILYFIRQQVLINDVQFLNGMIPHHSMAVLMAKKIKEKSKDPRVLQLADQIIQSQTKEITLMTDILNETRSNYYIF
jgi:hypothetical protein